MTREQIRADVLQILGEIAPETDPATIQGNLSFRDQLDIDSMDFLNFAIALEKHFGVSAPEIDYPQLSSLDGCVNYLARAIDAT